MHFFSHSPNRTNVCNNSFYFIGTFKEYLFAYKKQENGLVIYYKKIVDAGDWKVYIECEKYFSLNSNHNCFGSLPVAVGIDGSKILIAASNWEDDGNVMKVYTFSIPDRTFTQFEIVGEAPKIHQMFFCSQCFYCFIAPDPHEPSEYSIISWSPQVIKPKDSEEVHTRFLYLRFKLKSEEKECEFLKFGVPRLHIEFEDLSSNVTLLSRDAIIYATGNNEIKVGTFGDESWFALEDIDLTIPESSDLKEWKQLAFYQNGNQIECIAKENESSEEIKSYTFAIDIEKLTIIFTKKDTIYTSKKSTTKSSTDSVLRNEFPNFRNSRIMAASNSLFIQHYSKIFTKLQGPRSLSEICYLNLSGCKSDDCNDIAQSQNSIRRALKLPVNYQFIKSYDKFVV